MGKILIIIGHPNPQSYSAALASSYAEGAREAGAEVKVLSISTLNFDAVLHRGYGEEQTLEEDLQQAQSAITQAQHVVWFFPMWWVGLPAKMKGFIDRIFLPGWAFHYKNNLPKPLLKGRSSRVIMTMDSPRWWYWLAYGRAVWRTFNLGTLRFSGFSPVLDTPIYSVRSMSQPQRQRKLSKLRSTGTRDAQKLTRIASLPKKN